MIIHLHNNLDVFKAISRKTKEQMGSDIDIKEYNRLVDIWEDRIRRFGGVPWSPFKIVLNKKIHVLL